MEGNTQMMLFIIGLATIGGIAYLIAKMNSIELRLATQKQTVVVQQPTVTANTSSTPTSNEVAAFLPNGVYFIA
jgi:hypothetical protein